MRRQLALVFLSLSTMIVVAFLVPLAILIMRTAQDRAVDRAHSDAGAIVPALASQAGPSAVEVAIATTAAGRGGRITVLLPDATVRGALPKQGSNLAQALAEKRSMTAEVQDDSLDLEVIHVVQLADSQVAAVSVLVPREDQRRGVTTAWTALVGVGVALITLSVVAADRLARDVVTSTQQLAGAAQRLGDGDLAARVIPAGPPELQKLASVFNDLGAQVEGMLEREREFVAQASHRLRTPLTRLRLRIDQLGEGQIAGELRRDLDETAATLSRLIGDVRSSIEQRGQQQSSNVAEVVSQRLSFWSVLADEQEREVRLQLPELDVVASISLFALSEVLDIFIDNIFSHTPAGVGISLGVEPGQRVVRVWLKNLDPKDLKPAGREAHNGSSSGVGLLIAQNRVAAAGGKLEVRNDTGMFEVSMTLPLRTDQAEELRE